MRADPIERTLYLRVTRRAAELRMKLLKDQASHNAEQVSHLFKKR